jgi:2-keto-3-deoxy-L-rhamnonate aldolase RhmA
MAGMGRASRFGTVPDFFKAANASVAVVVQLETREAVANLEAIAAAGVDALFVGPADLSGTMGHVGELMHAEVIALMADAARRARALGMPIGTVGGTPEVVARYREMGFDYLAVASDLGLLMRGLQGAAQAIRGDPAPAASLAASPAAATAASAVPSAARSSGY